MTSVSVVAPLVMLRYRIKVRVSDHLYSSIVEHKERDRNKTIAKVGFYSAILTALLTVFSFVTAYLTPPLSGPFCAGGCFTYPYSDIASRFPRDYYWMYPAAGRVIECFVRSRWIARVGRTLLAFRGSFRLRSTCSFSSLIRRSLPKGRKKPY